MAAIDRDFWLTELSARAGHDQIAQTVLVQTSNTESETADLLRLTHPSIAGVVGWIDLTGRVEHQVEQLRSSPGGEQLVGIRHLAHQDADDNWLGRRSVGSGLSALGRLGLPFDLVIRPDQLALAATVTGAHPDTSFVLDHLGKPPMRVGRLDGWRRDIAALARHPNVKAKLSGLTIEANWSSWRAEDLREVVSFAVDVFTPDRLLFGSDWPLVELTGGMPRWHDTAAELTADLSHDERRGIFHTNALATYGIDTAEP